jgi:hypothetical protein
MPARSRGQRECVDVGLQWCMWRERGGGGVWVQQEWQQQAMVPVAAAVAAVLGLIKMQEVC